MVLDEKEMKEFRNKLADLIIKQLKVEEQSKESRKQIDKVANVAGLTIDWRLQMILPEN